MQFYHKFGYNNEFICWILVPFTGLPSSNTAGEQTFTLYEDACDDCHNADPGKWGW